MTDALEESAQRIAARGRDELVARLRPAFRQAAAAHRDVLELDEQRLEEMVQRAADEADGVQWRRALATVATEELGIGLGDALSHSAVVRAQELVGAPSYEEAVEELRRGPQAASEPITAAAEPDAEADPGEPEPEPEEPEPEAPESAPVPEEPQAGPAPLELTARHIHGVPDLTGERGELALCVSADGLDVKYADGRIIGRLPWSDIVEFEVPEGGALLRRRRTALIVRTTLGEATFEVNSSGAKLRQRLAPLIDHYLEEQLA